MMSLASYDTRLLAELQADARLSLAERGRRVHLSQPAVTDVAHLDAVVSKLRQLAETSTSIILKTLREHQVMLPPRTEPRP